MSDTIKDKCIFRIIKEQELICTYNIDRCSCPDRRKIGNCPKDQLDPNNERDRNTLNIIEGDYPDKRAKSQSPGFLKAKENYRRLIGVKDSMEKDDLKEG